MVYKPGESGNPTGRKKGEVNKLNIDIRQKFYKVYENMGKDEKISGDEAFSVWARGHKKVFYSLFAKLAPANLNINDNRQHESFMDRMAREMLEAEVVEVKTIETKSQLGNDKPQSSQLPMGKDAIVSPSNGGHMGNNTTDKESRHPIINTKFKEVVSGDDVEG